MRSDVLRSIGTGVGWLLGVGAIGVMAAWGARRGTAEPQTEEQARLRVISLLLEDKLITEAEAAWLLANPDTVDLRARVARVRQSESRPAAPAQEAAESDETDPAYWRGWAACYRELQYTPVVDLGERRASRVIRPAGGRN